MWWMRLCLTPFRLHGKPSMQRQAKCNWIFFSKIWALFCYMHNINCSSFQNDTTPCKGKKNPRYPSLTWEKWIAKDKKNLFLLSNILATNWLEFSQILDSRQMGYAVIPSHPPLRTNNPHQTLLCLSLLSYKQKVL